MKGAAASLRKQFAFGSLFIIYICVEQNHPLHLAPVAQNA